MIVQPKFRGFICTTAHPQGCSIHVKQQIEYVKEQGKFDGPKNVLIIGASTGYGLASRIATAFGAGANTIGVFYERPAAGSRTASPGWYNTAAFEREAASAGLYAKSINGDAFSDEVKQQTIDLIKADLGQVDLVIYSLAAPRRTDPVTKETYTSVLKPIGEPFTSKTVDFHSGEISTVTIEPADEEEIASTIKVMGGEDWQLWIKALLQNGVLAENCVTLAYSYIGPEITHAVYRSGTIGMAKEHLEASVDQLNQQLAEINGRAYVSVNKAVVTQASAAIPVVPLYASLLFKVMKDKNIHEGCVEQIYRLFTSKLSGVSADTDREGRIRLDDWEMRADVQQQVQELWEKINSENIGKLSDIKGFRADFFKLFGFEFPEVDYSQNVAVDIQIPSINN
ncbi:MAG: enoyl-ACP reductase FabV [Candidatus Wallacebacter cryptica]|jgi:enoyl-[acyl-carrier protein] reductase/trans-2-enoyl-CoA reductase (NAD+)|nr:trans-2-enoyl-CoA reductase family protein [Bacillota bacterium]